MLINPVYGGLSVLLTLIYGFILYLPDSSQGPDQKTCVNGGSFPLFQPNLGFKDLVTPGPTAG